MAFTQSIPVLKELYACAMVGEQDAGALIAYAWVNDDDTKRAYESSDETYRVFRKMLDSAHPPDDWDQLLSQAERAGNRLMQAFNTLNIP